MTVTRFAPSPTGLLHLGHVYAAGFAYQAAKAADGEFLVRLEDIDTTRVRPEYETAIFEDLEWLGMDWQHPVRKQSEHFDDYRSALARLEAMDLLYPCFCTRKEIQAEIAGAGQAPQGPDGPLYPGICRSKSKAEQEDIKLGIMLADATLGPDPAEMAAAQATNPQAGPTGAPAARSPRTGGRDRSSRNSAARLRSPASRCRWRRR